MKNLLLAFLLTLAACTPQAPAPAFRNQDVTGADFARQLQLTDHTGRERSLADFRGKLVIVNFGYTHCPDICPTTLAQLAGALSQLGPQAQEVQVLFVTLDPERDDQAQLARYVPAFYPSFLGLRGDAARTAQTAREFKVFYARRDEGSASGYAIDHSAGSYVYDRQGRLRLYVAPGTDRDALVHDLGLLLR